LIPGFADVRHAAMQAGALGCSISGAGPAMFAWALEPRAEVVRDAMRGELMRRQIESDDWIVEIGGEGARVVAAE